MATVREMNNDVQERYSIGTYISGIDYVRDFQSAYNKLLNDRNWEYTSKVAEVTSDDNGDIQLPEDFKYLVKSVGGRRGSGVWLKNDSVAVYPIYVVSPTDLGQYDSINQGVYTIFYRDVSTNELKYHNGQKRPHTVFLINYYRRAEKLTENSIPALVPEDYHEVLVLDVVIAHYERENLDSTRRDSYLAIKQRRSEAVRGLLDYDNRLFDGE